MKTNTAHPWRKAVQLVLVICLAALHAPVLADPIGRATLGIRDITFHAYSLGSNAVLPSPAQSFLYQSLSSVAFAEETLQMDRLEGNGKSALSTGVELAGEEGTSVSVYDLYSADLSAQISSASAPYRETSSNYRTGINLTMEPFSALTISGHIFGTLMLFGSDPRANIAFYIAVSGLPETPEWHWYSHEEGEPESFDERFSLTYYNRSATPKLIEFRMSGLAGAYASASPIPEPGASWMLASGLVLLMLRRRLA